MDTIHAIEVDLPTLMELVTEVVKMDPIDYGDLSIDEAKLRETCCLAALQVLSTASNFNAQDAMYVMVTSLAKMLEENVILHAHQLKHGEEIQNSMVRQILNKVSKK